MYKHNTLMPGGKEQLTTLCVCVCVHEGQSKLEEWDVLPVVK